MRDLVTEEPFVRLARGFLSTEECDHLRALVEPYVPFSVGVDIPDVGMTPSSDGASAVEEAAHQANFYSGHAHDPVNTGRGHAIPRRYDRVVAGVEARVARFAGQPEIRGEPLVVRRYDVKQRWTLHSDCLRRDEGALPTWAQEGGQRVMTVFLYLGEPEGGGETVFPERTDWAPGAQAEAGGLSECAQSGGVLAVKPRKGDVLAFWGLMTGDIMSAYACTPEALHASCPVLGGTKWVAAKYFRERPHNLPCFEEALSSSFGEPKVANASLTAQKFGRPQISCHTSSVGKPVPKPLSLAIPEDLRTTFEELSFKRRLGRGAGGEVVLATWRGQDVAVKVILPELALIPARASKFAREATILAPLRHPNVLKLLAVTTVAPDLGLVTELATRGNLLACLEAQNEKREAHVTEADDLAQRLRWARDTALGMNYLHTREPPVIHRDIKPLQILVHEDGHAILADFGIAATTDEIAREYKEAVEAGGRVDGYGTSEYMAPEVLWGDPCTPASDTYSFGISLFHILSGEYPWENNPGVGMENVINNMGHSKQEMWRRVARAKERPRSRRPLPGPPELHRLMESCWADKPEERPTMGRVAEQLQEILSRVG